MISPAVRLTVCRDCCCGNATKHPGVDHDAQLARLREIAEATGAAVTVSDCLDVCEHANVVVVHRRGGRPEWFGFVKGDGVLDDLHEWIKGGGPVPDTLELHRISPPVRS
ncbi:(2Fe-2S) ferredoxin domain-containing protein [Allokutzneria sp. A3M-2-11 16]|uniref:(2Fe-2S) ferredoxin domain-containing protein n=1 Tax=Allokutzneria sp. A3M-2-11 16 TaxID=2962043 RepID=UPI0020B691EB|nr:(2Fe-2S) ferredoxin domain-containing protein [Allokutzneria sp. A3M-2-11 16]MCP3801043.1 (2Fe-2S) ferredoxin domain-containing protein [Allokutzneria sp. A3M-2-11 16]